MAIGHCCSAYSFAAALWRLRQYKQRAKLKPFWVLATIILMLLLIVNEAIGLIPIRRARYFFVVWGHVVISDWQRLSMV